MFTCSRVVWSLAGTRQCKMVLLPAAVTLPACLPVQHLILFTKPNAPRLALPPAAQKRRYISEPHFSRSDPWEALVLICAGLNCAAASSLLIRSSALLAPSAQLRQPCSCMCSKGKAEQKGQRTRHNTVQSRPVPVPWCRDPTCLQSQTCSPIRRLSWSFVLPSTGKRH